MCVNSCHVHRGLFLSFPNGRQEARIPCRPRALFSSSLSFSLPRCSSDTPGPSLAPNQRPPFSRRRLPRALLCPNVPSRLSTRPRRLAKESHSRARRLRARPKNSFPALQPHHHPLFFSLFPSSFVLSDPRPPWTALLPAPVSNAPLDSRHASSQIHTLATDSQQPSCKFRFLLSAASTSTSISSPLLSAADQGLSLRLPWGPGHRPRHLDRHHDNTAGRVVFPDWAFSSRPNHRLLLGIVAPKAVGPLPLGIDPARDDLAQIALLLHPLHLYAPVPGRQQQHAPLRLTTPAAAVDHLHCRPS